MNLPPKSALLPFDEVVVTQGSRETHYGAEDFLALPLHQRVGFILSGRARFFRRGEFVPTDLALRALRQTAAP